MSKSPPDLSQHSLEEFEEIERLIRENTAADSDSDDDDSSVSQTIPKQHVNERVRGDTGYQSVGDFTLKMQEMADDRNDESISKSISDAESVNSSRSSLRRRSFVVDPKLSDIDDHVSEKSATDISLSIEQNAPNHSVADEDEDDEKLVATFGTTENFQALLQQQLEDKREEDSEEAKSSEEEPDPVVEEKRSSTTSTPRIVLPHAKKPQLRSRTTRSPAANRVRRANQKSKTWAPRSHSPGFPESSDDLSVHSDASRHELRRKLRKERVEREKENTIKNQLQSEYDELLTKYAEAENVIDQLRIGAKIDIFAQLPSETGEDEPKKMVESLPGNMTPQSEPVVDRRDSKTLRSSRDAITDTSLKLPATASKEFTRIALGHQANDLHEQMESFRALLNAGHIEDNEKRLVLDDIIRNLHKLESDYMNAAKEHEASKRAAILTGNGNGAAMEDFDSDHLIEGQIFQLGKLLEDLKERVAIGSSLPQTPVSSRRFQSSDVYSDSGESYNSTSNIDDRFNKQLKLYNKPALAYEEADTTASSHFLSSDEDTTVEYPGRVTPRQNRSRPSSTMPERFLRPSSSHSASPPKNTPRPDSNNDGSSPSRSLRSSFSPSKAESSFLNYSSQTDTQPRPRSRLPRPVATPSPNARSSSTPATNSKKSPSTNGMDGDSGFVESVSSRESMATGSSKNRSRKQELSPVLSVPPSERSAVSQSRRSSKQDSKRMKNGSRTRSGSKPSVFSASASNYSQEDAKRESDSQKNKHRTKRPPKSEDGSSTWSVPMKPAPPATTQIKTHGGTRSGRAVFTSTPYQSSPYTATPVHGSEKSRPSSRRSMDSSSRDSALDLLRGEIVKLRKELNAGTKPTEDISSRGHSEERPRRRASYASDSQATLTEPPSQRAQRSAREGRSRTRSSKQSRRSASEGTDKSRGSSVEKRDGKTGSDAPLRIGNVDGSSGGNGPDTYRGHWEYVAPYFSPVAASTQVLSPRPVPVPTVVAAALPQPPVVQFEPTYYSTIRYPSPARVYLPVPVSPAMYQAAPYETTYRRRRSSRKTKVFKKSEDSSDENDEPLRRSHLRTPVKRSSSVPPLRQSALDPQLSMSLERAERAADSLRQKSRSMYRSLRDSCNRAELSFT